MRSPRDHARRWAEFKAVLCLRHGLPGGPLGLRGLLDAYPDCQSAVADCAHWTERGLVPRVKQEAFRRRDWIDPARIEYERVQALGHDFVLWSESAYPALVRHLPDAPPLLYLQGDRSLLSGPCLAVVGARKASRRAGEMSLAMASELSAAGVSVVSGLAFGVDRQAHLGGLSGVGSSVAVVGTGLDVAYPAGNRDLWERLGREGLIVSEFAPGSRPMPHHFPIRNRIMSGLSLGVLVVEAKEKSGSRITARLSMEQGREVFVVPGSPGCDALARDGATAVECAGDILRELAPQLGASLREAQAGAAAAVPWGLEAWSDAPAASEEPASEDALAGLPPKARALWELLDPKKAAHVDDLGRGLRLDAAETNRLLVVLELEGLAKRRPGMLFVRA